MRLAAVFILTALSVSAADNPAYELPPINYSATQPKDSVAFLKSRLAAGTSTLKSDDSHGYLKSFLAELKVPVSSQTLVFSKTSLQRQKIWPRLPRAIYFNDDVYVGWVNNGDVLEISAVDPQLGAVFYTLSQRSEGPPQISRQTHNCLQCHDSNAMTLGIPGHMVRSVYPDDEGMPNYSMGTFRTNDRSPYAERWGGWYVTGEHGSMRHMGNVIYPNDPNPDMKLFGNLGANKTDLSQMVAIKNYLAETSDIVALLVLEHQAYVHNLIARANHETRLALLQSDEINKLTNTPKEQLTEGARSRIRGNCESLVEALLFVEEPPLTDPVKGNSTFTAEFEARGPFDVSGRSLRQFDLKSRMFKYPCSYLVYSDAFKGLPKAAQEYIADRFYKILSGADTSKQFAHLTPADRAALQEILRATLPDFTAAWPKPAK